MKKSYILLSTLLASLLALAGCNKPNPSTGGQESNPSNSEVSTPSTGGQEESSKPSEEQSITLAAPVVIVSEEGLASWEAVANATGYIYKLNGKEMATLKTSLQLEDGDTLQVKAKGNGKEFLDSDYSAEVTYEKGVQVGLPTPEQGFYMRDADVIQDGNTRYLVYTTNKSVAQEDNVIALRKGELTEEGWVYEEEQTILLEGAETGWDQYLGSASIAKGNFGVGEETYNWVMAYQASTSDSNVANQIGLAFAKEIDGQWDRLTFPVVKYDADVYGANMVGAYAPSVVNYNKDSGVRIFYTYADAYGHFAFFYDVDLADATFADNGVSAMITNNGNIHSGDAVTMFPNADYAYDSVNKVFYAVKDYSPSAATKPSFAEEIELLHIAEEELYTTDPGTGWVSDYYVDYIDLDNGYERAYSPCIVADVYGHTLEVNEIVYNVCEIGNEYVHTQKFLSYIEE